MRKGKNAVVDKKLHSCWVTMNGICVKVSESGERVFIKCMEDLDAVLGTEVATKSVGSSKKNNKRKASKEQDNPAKVKSASSKQTSK